jgi:hypothetical protein
MGREQIIEQGARALWEDHIQRLIYDPDERSKERFEDVPTNAVCWHSARIVVDAMAPLIRQDEDAIRADERRKTAEKIAQAIELWLGNRCPACKGKPASVKWASGPLRKIGRCGCGHMWEHKDRADGKTAESIAREIGGTS